MTEVDITTGEKSNLQYLWKPIYTNIQSRLVKDSYLSREEVDF